MASEFWGGVRHVAKAIGQAFGGNRALTEAARNATPMHRAIATAHTAGSGIVTQNYWENLQHMTSWSFPAIDAFAMQVEGSSVCAYSKQRQVNKSHAQDAPAPQRTPIHDHEALDLLERPNPVFWREIWMYHIACQYKLTGGWIIWEVRSKETGKPCEYWTLPRSWLTFLPGQKDYPMGMVQVRNPRGMSGYWGDNPLASGFMLDVRDLIIGGRPHPIYPGEPISTMTSMGRVIDICEEADAAVWSSLLNAPRPGMILMLDPKAGPVDPEQLKRMVDKIQADKGGTNNAGKVTVLQGVASIEGMGTPMGDLDAVNVREQNMKFVLAAHSTPSIAIGARNEVGSYSGNAAEINTWIELHVQPFLNRFYGCLNHRNHRYWPDVKLEGSAKRQDDPTLEGQEKDRYMTGYEKGIFTLNQVLAVFNEPPVPGEGDERKAQPDPNAMGGIGPDGQPVPPGQEQPGDAQQADDPDALDLSLDAPDEDGPGIGRPDLSRAGGRGFALNGRH